MSTTRRRWSLVLVLAALTLAVRAPFPDTSPPPALSQPTTDVASIAEPAPSPPVASPPVSPRIPTVTASLATPASASPTPSRTVPALPSPSPSPARPVPTVRAARPTRLPEPNAVVTGRVAYPWPEESARSVALFFENLETEAVTEVALLPGTSAYTATLPSGVYQAYTWSPDWSEKGAYTACVRGPGYDPDACQDHTLAPITATLSVTTTGIDLLDWWAPEGEPLYLAGTLIDGTGAGPVPDVVLVVRETRIVALGPSDELPISEDALRLNVTGATLLPGFFNTHVHNTGTTALLVRWAQSGVTTVRDLGMRAPGPYFEERDRLAPFPRYARVLAAGPLVTVPEGYPEAGNGFPSLPVTSPEHAREAVSALIDEGADVIKIVFESSVGPMLSREEAAAIVETAHERGIPVSAHVTDSLELRRALDAGIDDAAPIVTGPVSDEVIERMVRQDVAWVPTLEVMRGAGLTNLARFVADGGRVALGTDAGYLAGLQLGMPMREMGYLLEAGMTPMEVIVAATGDAAYVCRCDASLGTLEVGKIADVLVVSGDPLQDLQALTDVLLVVHLGTVIRGEVGR